MKKGENGFPPSYFFPKSSVFIYFPQQPFYPLMYCGNQRLKSKSSSEIQKILQGTKFSQVHVKIQLKKQKFKTQNPVKCLLLLKSCCWSKRTVNHFPQPSLPLITFLSLQTFISTWSIGWKPVQISAKKHPDM